MIVSRKPWAIYDVDVIGAGSLVVILLAAWWLVAAPWQQTWNGYSALASKRAATEARLRDDVANVDEFEVQLAHLADLVDAEAHEVPSATAQSAILQQFTDIAKAEHIELIGYAPESATTTGTYVITDIRVDARGTCRDFARFLDHLAQENPYQSLVGCTIIKPTNATSDTCALNWTMRLFMQPGDRTPEESLAK